MFIDMMKTYFSKPKPAIPAGRRVYAVGDVHGRLDLLEDILAMIERDNATRVRADVTLLMLGDLIDRGLESRGVVERVRKGVAWAQVVPLMGNHESIMLSALDGDKDSLQSWLRFGGRETLISWGVGERVLDESTFDDIIVAARDAICGDELRWIRRMRSAMRVGGYYFVHAGVRPGVSLDQQVDDDRLWIREPFLESRKNHGAVVVHGHSIGATVEQRHNRIGLDTGAYLSNRLTAVGLQGADRWFLDTAA